MAAAADCPRRRKRSESRNKANFEDMLDQSSKKTITTIGKTIGEEIAKVVKHMDGNFNNLQAQVASSTQSSERTCIRMGDLEQKVTNMNANIYDALEKQVKKLDGKLEVKCNEISKDIEKNRAATDTKTTQLQNQIDEALKRMAKAEQRIEEVDKKPTENTTGKATADKPNTTNEKTDSPETIEK